MDLSEAVKHLPEEIEFPSIPMDKVFLDDIQPLPIDENWLRNAGFKFDEVQGRKHWLLWIGQAVGHFADGKIYASHYDLGVEIAASGKDGWNVWVRADYAGRYCRFVHVRYMNNASEVVALIEALTGVTFNAENVYYGSLRTPQVAAHLRKQDEEHLHRRLAKEWGKRVLRETGADPDKRELLKP